jgi:hypothetical protein
MKPSDELRVLYLVALVSQVYLITNEYLVLSALWTMIGVYTWWIYCFRLNEGEDIE